MITLTNTSYTTVQNSYLTNSLGITLSTERMNKNVSYLNNIIEQYHIGVFNESKIAGGFIKNRKS